MQFCMKWWSPACRVYALLHAVWQFGICYICLLLAIWQVRLRVLMGVWVHLFAWLFVCALALLPFCLFAYLCLFVCLIVLCSYVWVLICVRVWLFFIDRLFVCSMCVRVRVHRFGCVACASMHDEIDQHGNLLHSIYKVLHSMWPYASQKTGIGTYSLAVRPTAYMQMHVQCDSSPHTSFTACV